MSIDLSRNISSRNSTFLLCFVLCMCAFQVGCHPFENRWRRSPTIDSSQEDDWAPPKMNTQSSSYRTPKQFRTNNASQASKSGATKQSLPATYKPPESQSVSHKTELTQVAKDSKIRHRLQDSPSTDALPAEKTIANNVAKQSDDATNIIETPPQELDLGGAIAALPPNLQLVLKRQLDALEKREIETYALTSPKTSNDVPEKKVTMRLSDSENGSDLKSSASTLASTETPLDKTSSTIATLVPPPASSNTTGLTASAMKPQSSVATTAQSSATPSATPPAVQLASATSLPQVASKSQVVTASATSVGSVHSGDVSNASFQPISELKPTPTESKNPHWNHDLSESIAKLEKQLKENPSTDDNVRISQEMTLRMLYLANRQLEEAMRPIEGLSESERNYIRHQAQALYEASNPDAVPVPSRKWTLVMNSQRAATDQLAAVSNLEVKSLAFCTDVQGYGVISKFANNIFKPDQDLLLYCELDNVAADEVKEGFETQLQGSYEIIDPNGRRIADQLLPMEKEICRNHRRDYFIVYRIYTPMQIGPGNYQLRLTVEDMKAKKFGQSTLDFQIQK